MKLHFQYDSRAKKVIAVMIDEKNNKTVSDVLNIEDANTLEEELHSITHPESIKKQFSILDIPRGIFCKPKLKDRKVPISLKLLKQYEKQSSKFQIIQNENQVLREIIAAKK